MDEHEFNAWCASVLGYYVKQSEPPAAMAGLYFLFNLNDVLVSGAFGKTEADAWRSGGFHFFTSLDALHNVEMVVITDLGLKDRLGEVLHRICGESWGALDAEWAHIGHRKEALWELKDEIDKARKEKSK